MKMLAASTAESLELVLILHFASLVDADDDKILTKLRRIHNKYEDDETVNYPQTTQFGVQMAIRELELNEAGGNIPLDISANDA